MISFVLSSDTLQRLATTERALAREKAVATSTGGKKLDPKADALPKRYFPTEFR